jgi:hypothetical protein
MLSDIPRPGILGLTSNGVITGLAVLEANIEYFGSGDMKILDTKI